MSYETERDKLARTQQAILTLAVTRCCNWYATEVGQVLQNTQDIPSGWTQTSLTLVGVAQSVPAPDGAIGTPSDIEGATAFTFDIAGTSSLRRAGSGDSPDCTSVAFTGSFFVKKATGSGTLTLRVRDVAGTEFGTLVMNLTTSWQRFSVHKLFSGVPTGKAMIEIFRDTTDTGAEVHVWGANLSVNPGAVNRAVLFPYRERDAETYTDINARVSRCQASDAGDGNRCEYSPTTCQDLANINAGNDYEGTVALKGLREHKFCLHDGPLPLKGAQIAPMLESYTQAAQEILPRESLTRNERATFNLLDDAAPGIWNLEKQTDGALINTQSGQGTFARRFLPIHKNYTNPKGYARLAVGFVAEGMTEADYRVRIEGPMLNLRLLPRGRWQIESSDGLRLTKLEKVPRQISKTNLIQGALTAGATSLSVDNPREISDPPLDGAYKVTLFLNALEKVNVLGKTRGGNPLTIERGRWGTTAIAHADNAPFTETLEFGTEQTAPANPVLGKNFIDVTIELARRAGIPASKIDTARLNQEKTDWLYSSIDLVYVTQQGKLYTPRTVTDPTSIDELLREIRDAVVMNLWWDDLTQKFTGRVFAPPGPTETVPELTDVTGWREDSVAIEDDDKETRFNQVVVAYNPIPGERGDLVRHYQDIEISNDGDAQGPAFFGDFRQKIILSPCIRAGDSATARTTAARILSRFSRGARVITGACEAKDDDNVLLGGYVTVATAMLQDYSGALDSMAQFQVMKRQRASPGRIRLELLDTYHLRRPMFIAPNGQPDYDSATAAQQRYWYIGNAQNRVGAANDDGYYVP